MKFLDYSRASVAETISHCYVVLDQAYIDGSEMEAVNQQADIVWKKVNNSITYLNRTVKTGVKKARSGYNHNQLNQSQPNKTEVFNHANGICR